MPKKIDPLNRKQYGAITAMLTVADVKAAASFYQKAFGFTKRGTMNGPDGKPMHAELTLRGTTLMLGPENPKMGMKSAKTAGTSPTTLYLLTENVDKVVGTARRAFPLRRCRANRPALQSSSRAGKVPLARLARSAALVGFKQAVGLDAPDESAHRVKVDCRPSITPGTYFRMMLLGYFEGIDSERGIAWRAADSRKFLDYDLMEQTPDHSTVSRTHI